MFGRNIYIFENSSICFGIGIYRCENIYIGAIYFPPTLPISSAPAPKGQSQNANPVFPPYLIPAGQNRVSLFTFLPVSPPTQSPEGQNTVGPKRRDGFAVSVL